MKYCLDTDIVIEYLKGNPLITSQIDSSDEQFGITPITVLELFYGAYRSAQVERRIKEVQDVLLRFQVLFFTQPVAELFGKIKTELEEQGQMLDNFDLVIGSFCCAHRLVLVTNNVRHFERISGLLLENWANPNYKQKMYK